MIRNLWTPGKNRSHFFSDFSKHFSSNLLLPGFFPDLLDPLLETWNTWIIVNNSHPRDKARALFSLSPIREGFHNQADTDVAAWLWKASRGGRGFAARARYIGPGRRPCSCLGRIGSIRRGRRPWRQKPGRSPAKSPGRSLTDYFLQGCMDYA